MSMLLPLLFAPLMPQEIALPYEKFVLDNGLQVVVHEDHSDPVVAVYVVYHVGSAREEPGRSGFAHLFEHIMFQGSQHVGDEQHFKLVSEAGGTLNGTTNTDRTNYFETLPSNHLELGLWLEADRMGFLLPAVNQDKLDRQRDVVKNERRQNYENRPYGQARGRIAAALYPPDHPYSWLTIGSHEDLTAASLEDVHAFFKRWYGPNNATLAIGGDVDPAQVRTLVESWFGDIPRGPEVARPAARAVKLERSKRLVLEDKVKLPQLSMTWPTVQRDHPDEAALDVLARVLSANRAAVLDRALTIDEELASMVSAGHDGMELTGQFSITLRPARGVTLDTLEARVDELLRGLAEEGVDPEHLARVQTRYEADFVRRLETVSARTSRMAEDNTFREDPGYAPLELARTLAVTPADVVRVLRDYVLDKPAVVLSVVPEGQLQLAASNPPAPEVAAIPDPRRAKRPEAGAPPAFRAPAVWHADFANGVAALGTIFNEVPMTTVSLSVPAGRVYETPATLGLSSLCAELLEQGTARLSTVELVNELDRLGASLRVSADDDEITLSVTALDKHLDQAVALLGDVLLEPRLAQEDFERLRKERLIAIETRSDRIASIAGDVWDRLTQGETVLGMPSVGTASSVAALTIDDMRGFWKKHGIPEGARLTYVGARDADGMRALFQPIFERWQAPEGARASAVEAAHVRPAASGRIYLVDKPGAAQSEIRIGHPSVASTDPDYWPLSVLNYVLGGAFNSRINLNLREDKGWAYGARSLFSGGRRPGPFVASAGVQTDHTAESVAEFLKEIEGILTGPTDEELLSAKSALEQAATRQYESMRARLSMLDNIGVYDWPDDYVERRMQETRAIERERLTELAREYVHPDQLIVLVVGDKERVKDGLAALDIGPVIELAEDGRPLE